MSVALVVSWRALVVSWRRGMLDDISAWSRGAACWWLRTSDDYDTYSWNEGLALAAEIVACDPFEEDLHVDASELR